MTPQAPRNKRSSAYRIVIWLTLAALALQYMLGMAINLYVAFPSSVPNGNAWGWAMGHSTVVKLHVYVGSILVLLSLVAIGLAISVRRPRDITGSVLGFVVIAFTWLSGDEFMLNGQQNGSSLRMAVGFLLAFIVYVANLLLTRYAKSQNLSTVK